ncbi:MAG: hypothetical protein LBL04_16765 [Bacteroidales bacterium]|jgi:hypothetical protein|nr:hypothetical protein [Bacteroidales bacterium]
MAKQKGNVVTHGLNGKIGDLPVFCQRDGQTVVSKVPEQEKTASGKQVELRQRVSDADADGAAVEEGYAVNSVAGLRIYRTKNGAYRKAYRNRAYRKHTG